MKLTLSLALGRTITTTTITTTIIKKNKQKRLDKQNKKMI
jgi:hypothetical protein